jgi:hypothetical protein
MAEPSATRWQDIRWQVIIPVALFILGALWLSWPSTNTAPPLLDGLSDDGLQGAPCPARDLYEQKARTNQGARAPAHLGERLRQEFPLGSDAAPLVNLLTKENFTPFAPCPNDESVEGARWLSRSWSLPDAFIYWRVDDRNRLTFLDGHVSRTR